MLIRTLFPGLMAAASGVIAASEFIAQTNKHFLFDFRDSQNFTQKDIDMWWESSDTVRRPGMSKAALSLQSTQLYQRGILFVLLNPQPNGAGFAGVKRSLEGIDLSEHIGFELRLRGQGLNHWKVVLNHNMKDVEDKVTYEKFFNLTSIAPDFDSIKVPLNEFKPYFRGQEVDGPPIKPDRISTFGLQAYGGVYEVDKQSGPGSLEIEYIAAYY